MPSPTTIPPQSFEVAWGKLAASKVGAVTKQSKILIWSVLAGLIVLVAASIAFTFAFSTLGTKSVTATKLAIPPASESPTAAAVALPSGFKPESASFVSSQTGFVLGIAHCTSGYCLTIARTQDGGTTWSSIPAPNVSLTQSGDPKSSIGSVSQIRFLTINDGYLFGPDLYATHDRGATWQKLTLKGIPSTSVVTALETNGSNWYLTAENPNAPTPKTGYLFISNGTSGVFTIQRKPVVPAGARAEITANPYGAVLNATLNQNDNLFYQAPGSTSWTRIKANCPVDLPTNPLVALAMPVSGSSTPQLVLGCKGNTGAGSQEKTVVESRDLATFTPTKARPPLGGDLGAIASPNGETIAVAASSGATFLYVSTDSGASWKTVISDPSFGGAPIHDLGFTTANQGFAVIGHATIDGTRTSTFVMTHDQGSSWQEVSF